MCFRILKAGYVPVIAHAERYAYVCNGIADIKKLRDMGCLIQVNLFSIISSINGQINRLAREIIYHKMAEFVGSDAHRMNHRPPKIACGAEEIIKMCGEDYAKDVLEANARKWFGI